MRSCNFSFLGDSIVESANNVLRHNIQSNTSLNVSSGDQVRLAQFKANLTQL